MKSLIITLFSASLLFSQEFKQQVSLLSTIQNSNLIVSGQVVDKQSYWDINHKLIYTVHKVEVEKLFKGSERRYIYFLTEGGSIGLKGLIVSKSININKESIGYFNLIKEEEIVLKDFEHNAKLLSLTNKKFGYLDYDPVDDLIIIEQNNKLKVEDFEKQLTDISKKNPKNLNNSSKSFFKGSLVSNQTEFISLSPQTINAGNKEILTITGIGFGNYQSNTTPNTGSVYFFDADSGGSNWNEVLESQIISWSDTEILVEVPSRAGTGNVRIRTNENLFFESDQIINIPYNITGYPYEGIEYPIYHPGSVVDDFGAELDSPGSATPQDNVTSGQFHFTLNTDFSDNIEARESFDYNLREWVCNGGINFDISSETTEINEAANDFVNVVTFVNSQSLGTTYYWFNGCVTNDSDGNISSATIFFEELDISFNASINWGYGDNVANNQYDFDMTALHEIGHALGMGHVIDSGGLMHYAGGSGNQTFSIDNYLPAQNIILQRNISGSVCGVLDPHVVSDCSSIDPNQDLDGDGVPDIFDDCPGTPTGETVDNSGCGNSQKDSDGDGVSDDVDQCSTTPQGVVVDVNGCADSDNDGVFDYVDLCPNTSDNSIVDNDGCADYQRDTDGDGVNDDLDQCSNTPQGESVDVYGCTILLLPYDNFQVTVTSNTCLGTNDGSIFVSVNDESLQYQVKINGQEYGLNSNYGFNTIVENLGVGTYPVCFYVNGYNEFEQCFNVVLSQPDPLSVDASQSVDGKFLNLTLDGSSFFNLVHNGVESEVSPGKLSIELIKGLNTIIVSTKYDCQGIFEETYFNSEDIVVHPNPTNDFIGILVGGSDEQVQFLIRDIRGTTLINSSKNLEYNRKVELDLSDFSNGVYFLEVTSHNVRQTSKIIKYD